MGYRKIGLNLGFLSLSFAAAAAAQIGSDFTVATLVTNQGTYFPPKDVVFIQQYYAYAPMFFVEDILRRERALPAKLTASIERGKPLPRDLAQFLQQSPASVTRGLGPLPRGLDRKVLGSRFLLLDSRQIVRDIIHLPTAPSKDRRK